MIAWERSREDGSSLSLNAESEAERFGSVDWGAAPDSLERSDGIGVHVQVEIDRNRSFPVGHEICHC